jgi:RNA 3'-terminal phosphate cyclase (GTP)
MIRIDASYGEGGGQIIRTALALSTITQKPFEAFNIRKGREEPGLKAQHLHCIKALQELCDAKAEHSGLRSTTLKYEPGKIKGKDLRIDIGTAGSVSLLLQAVLLPCFFANKRLKLNIIGGTSGKWAMPFDYFNNVLVPHLSDFCDKLEVKLIRRGYYPKGGGEIEIKINPKYKLSDYKSFDEFWKDLREKGKKIELIEQGKLLQIKGVSHASKFLQNANVGERQAKAAEVILNYLKVPVDIRIEYCDTLSPGSGIELWGIFSDVNTGIGADVLGERGKRAEDVGKEAGEKFVKEIKSGAAVDSHLADNMIPWLALFYGKIKVSEITEHCRTNIWICEQFLGKIFEIDEDNKIISSK